MVRNTIRVTELHTCSTRWEHIFLMPHGLHCLSINSSTNQKNSQRMCSQSNAELHTHKDNCQCTHSWNLIISLNLVNISCVIIFQQEMLPFPHQFSNCRFSFTTVPDSTAITPASTVELLLQSTPCMWSYKAAKKC